MPSSWSNDRERQYEKIKSSAQRRGRSAGSAKRIAAATVNKTRRRKGETKGSAKSRRLSSRSSGRSSTRRKRAAGGKGGRR